MGSTTVQKYAGYCSLDFFEPKVSCFTALSAQIGEKKYEKDRSRKYITYGRGQHKYHAVKQ